MSECAPKDVTPAPSDTARQVVTAFLRIRWDPSAIDLARALCASREVDWDAVARVAATEGVAPLLFHVL